MIMSHHACSVLPYLTFFLDHLKFPIISDSLNIDIVGTQGYL